MVLPDVLLKRYKNAFIHYASTVPRLDQHILARFMADGQFSRHLNRMRTIYRRKLQTLVDAILPYSPYISYSGEEAGMHIIITIHTDCTEEKLIESAKKSGIRIYGLNKYRKNPVEGEPSFLIGFGGLSVDTIKKTIEDLMLAWKINKSDESI
jgi:GntR family transcriptional regulator / MocR family aminotransferase